MSEVTARDHPEPDKRPTRRDVLAGLSVLGLGIAAGTHPASAQPENERPREGDLLVSSEGENPSPKPLRLDDIRLGGPPIQAWPMDPASRVIRMGSRLNKVLLVRLDPESLVGVTRERAAEGVVAYSAVCPHAGCEVTLWVADQKILECLCHYSHFNPREAAVVIDGPAPRALAALPLKIVNGNLAVARPFTGRVGIVPT